MHQNDAETMQQNATQLNPIPIPWNRIKTQWNICGRALLQK